MARRTGEGVRIGPITLLTLVSVLLLAVLAMLCITTTHATEAMAQRQADALSQTYELDAFGQALLAQIDDQIAESGSPAAAAALVQHRSDKLLENAAEAKQRPRPAVLHRRSGHAGHVHGHRAGRQGACRHGDHRRERLHRGRLEDDLPAQELPEQALLSTN